MIKLVPDWAPNLHPLIIHFPIVLLITAVGFNLLMLLFKKEEWLRNSTTLLYILGGVSAVAAFLSGRQGAESVSLPPLANPILSEHADLALWTILFFGVLTVVHLVLIWRASPVNRIVDILLFFMGAVGLILIFKTAEHGAQLVYKHGVGVQSGNSVAQDKIENTGDEKIKEFFIDDNGSWHWQPGRRADLILADQFAWLEGSAKDLYPIVDDDPEKGTILTLKPNGKSVLFVIAKALESVQVDLTLKLDNFDGIVRLVHHLQNKLTYDFLSIENGTMKLGMMDDGKEKLLKEKSVEMEGWLNIRIVSDGRHFRGYLDDELLTHGHGSVLPPGNVGLWIDGVGRVLIERIEVQSLR